MSDESGHSDCGELLHIKVNRKLIECRYCGASASSMCSIVHAHGCLNACDGKMADPRPAPLEPQIRATCNMLADFLVEKNRAYGNSAGEPVGIFARRADPLLQIDVRIDDKINRLKKGSEYPGDDTVKDLAGYLILRMIVAEQQKRDGAK